MPTFHVAVLDADGRPRFSGIAEVNERLRGGLREWRGHFKEFDGKPMRAATTTPGEYTLRLDDGSEYAVIINSVRVSSPGPRVSVEFVGARGEAPQI